MAVLSLLALALAASPSPVLAIIGDPSARILWTRTFTSPGNDWINDLVPLPGGDILAIGFLNRIDEEGSPSDWRALAARIAPDGRVRAQHEYGEGSGIDAFWAAQIAPSGEQVLAGFTTRIGAKGINALATFTDAEGKLLTERAFGGDGYDRFTDVAPATDGYVFLGHSEPADRPGHRRLFAVKTDRAGSPIWERVIGGPNSIAALYIEPAGDGGFIVAGGIDAGSDDSDILVLKLDADGREIWRQRVGGPGTSDVNHGLAVRPDGRILVVGYSQSWGARDNDILAATLSPDGKILKQEMYGGANDDRPILLKLGQNGRAWIAGYTKSGSVGGWDMIVTSLDESGSFEDRALIIGSPADDNGTAILPLADGSLIAAGYSRGLGSDSEDAFVVHIAKPAWTRAHPDFARRVVE